MYNTSFEIESIVFKGTSERQFAVRLNQQTSATANGKGRSSKRKV